MIADELEGQTITIPVRQFVDLYVANTRLNALESFGVDNWQGYDEALDTADYDNSRVRKELIQQLKQEGIICEK